jgi:hypothetical protein
MEHHGSKRKQYYSCDGKHELQRWCRVKGRSQPADQTGVGKHHDALPKLQIANFLL